MKKLIQIVSAVMFISLASFLPACSSEDDFTEVVKSSELDQSSSFRDRSTDVAKPDL